MGMLYAGTSGFAYPAWKPDFYPADLPPKRFLEHYGRRLNSVEVNYTFRQTPTAQTLAGWFEQTPEGFLFTLKAHQRITHILRLKNAGGALEHFFRAIDPLRSSRRLGPVLFQLPPNFKRDDTLLADFLALLPDGVRCAFEFRHESWLAQPVYELLGKFRAALCHAESEKLMVPDVVTAPHVYWRLRLPDYTPEDRGKLAAKCRELAGAGREVFVYFKHEDDPKGALWAEQLLADASVRGQG